MAREPTDDPSVFILKKWILKLKIVCQQLKSKSDVTCYLSCIPRPKATVADAVTPTEVELCCAMCGMFPEGFKIPIQNLVIYGMGLKLFKDVHNVSEGRDRVNHLLENLLNLPSVKIKVDERDNQYVKMQGAAYYSATFAARRNALVLNHDFMMEKWPNINKLRSFYGLLFHKASPVDLECSNFVLLHFQYDDEDSQGLFIDFLKGVEVQVLSLDVPSLPQSLTVLRYLRTLLVKVVQSKDMSIIGGLLDLEYLSMSTSRLAEIPKEMGNLVNLRLLDLRKVIIAYIPPGVLSRMSKLEELYMPLSFRRWGCCAKDDQNNYDEWDSEEGVEYVDDERINASLTEIINLPLNVLQICVPKASVLPKKSVVFRNIQQFKILLPDYSKYQPFGEVSLNTLQLTGDACDIHESRICDLMTRTENLRLTKVRNLKNTNYFMCRLEDNDSPRLKKMMVNECHELEYFLSGEENWIPCSSFWELRNLYLSTLPNLKEILHRISRWSHSVCFTNLRRLSIRFCHELKYVFPLSVVVEMRRIQSIEIHDCDEMKGIFYNNVMDDNNYGVNFIEELFLHSLPKLMGLVVDKDDIVNGADEANEVLFIKNEGVVRHSKMHCAFSSKLMDRRWSCLDKLKISFCDPIEVIFSFEKNHATMEFFNSLKELELYGLRNLRHIWFQIPSEIVAFQKLQLLVLSECRNTYVLTTRITKLLVLLQKLLVSRCGEMETIVSEEDREEVDVIEDVIVFPQLKAFELQNMPKLKTFYCGAYGTELALLESVKLNQCNKMESLSNGWLNTPRLEKIQVDGSLYALMGDVNATIRRLKVEKVA